jgi:hypothetical protein
MHEESRKVHAYLLDKARQPAQYGYKQDDGRRKQLLVSFVPPGIIP